MQYFLVRIDFVVLHTHHAVVGKMSSSILIFVSCFTDTQVRRDENGRVMISGGAVSNLVTWQDERCTEEFLQTLPASKITPLSSGRLIRGSLDFL